MFRSSLANLSEKLSVERDDDCEHQAGSDSKITAKCFFALKRIGDGSVENCKGDIFGLTPSDIGSMLMQKREQKQSFNIKKQGLTEKARFGDFEHTYYDDTEGYSEDLLNYNMSGELMDDAMDSTGSLGKSSFLMMHPGLASQLSPQSQYYA